MKSGRSRKELRRESILAALEVDPALRVNELAATMGVSTETIRRDLADLDELGRLSRTYGGAVSAARRFEPALNERMRLNVAERRAIAQLAAGHVAAEETLLLGGGATMLQFARALRRTGRRLTVITASYPVALELSGNPMIEIALLPGTLEAQERMVCGPATIRAVERFHAPVALIGASGLSEDGVSEAMLGVGEVYSAMLRSSGRSLVLADHGKFGKRALVLLTGWSERTTLITDRAPGGALLDAMRAAGAGLLVPETRPPGPAP